MTQATQQLLYAAKPELPKDFDKRLRSIVGTCPTGEPGFRFEWGCDRKKWYGGRENIAYFDPNGKYVGLPYFVAEGWTPPTVYDRGEWDAGRYGMLIDDMKWGPCRSAEPVPCQAPEHFLTRHGYHQVWDPSIDVLGPFPEKGVWDLIAFCHTPAPELRPLTPEELLNVAREWKHNRERPQAVQRIISDYMRFNDNILAMKEKAFEEAKGEHREMMARELAKPDTNRVNSFDTIGAAPRSKRQLEPGQSETPAGLIVPTSALNN